MNKPKVNYDLTLEESEKDYWKEPDFFPTGLVEKCFKYRKVPLKNLTIEQLRTLIGQNIGLKFLIPLATEKLKDNILAEGNFYEGDLLSAVVTSDVKFWIKNPELHKEVVKLIKLNADKLLPISQFHRDIAAFETLCH